MRDAKPGELREIRVLESLERLSKRPESRMDVQKMLTNLSPNSQIYAKHLVMSGPSSLIKAAKACGLQKADIESALDEMEKGIAAIRG